MMDQNNTPSSRNQSTSGRHRDVSGGRATPRTCVPRLSGLDQLGGPPRQGGLPPRDTPTPRMVSARRDVSPPSGRAALTEREIMLLTPRYTSIPNETMEQRGRRSVAHYQEIVKHVRASHASLHGQTPGRSATVTPASKYNRSPGQPDSTPREYSRPQEMDLSRPTNVARLVSEHTAMKAEIKLLKRQLRHSMAQLQMERQRNSEGRTSSKPSSCGGQVRSSHTPSELWHRSRLAHDSMAGTKFASPATAKSPGSEKPGRYPLTPLSASSDKWSDGWDRTLAFNADGNLSPSPLPPKFPTSFADAQLLSFNRKE